MKKKCKIVSCFNIVRCNLERKTGKIVFVIAIKSVVFDISDKMYSAF